MEAKEASGAVGDSKTAEPRADFYASRTAQETELESTMNSISLIAKAELFMPSAETTPGNELVAAASKGDNSLVEQQIGRAHV